LDGANEAAVYKFHPATLRLDKTLNKRAFEGTLESHIPGSSNDSSIEMKIISIPLFQGPFLIRTAMRDGIVVNEIMKSCYERSLFGFKILPSDYWLDLGAHIGVFTSMALSAGAKVVAVEPEPCNFDLLSQNAESNN
jgi:hypothetical protein